MVARAVLGPPGAGRTIRCRSPRTEQCEVVFCAPGGELTQVQRIRLSGQTRVAGEEANQCQTLGAGEERVVVLDGGGHVLGVHGGPPLIGSPQLTSAAA